MAEETNELNEKDVQRIADALYKKMKEKEEKEMKEKLDKEKGDWYVQDFNKFYAVCLKCGCVLTREQYIEPACYNCGGTKARIITK